MGASVLLGHSKRKRLAQAGPTFSTRIDPKPGFGDSAAQGVPTSCPSPSLQPPMTYAHLPSASRISASAERPGLGYWPASPVPSSSTTARATQPAGVR